MHCYPVDGRIFSAQLRAAAEGGLAGRLIAPDLPGFGASPVPGRPPRAYSVDELGVVLSRFIDALQLDHPVIGGVAIGGSVALALAARNPTAVEGLVLIANRPAPDAPDKAAAREAVALRVMTDGSAAVAADLADAALAPGASDRTRARVRAMIADADPRGIAALVRAVARRPDPAALLPTIGLPTLVIAGAEDPMGSPGEVERLARMLPRSRFVPVAGAGHMVPIERPAATTRALDEFVRARG